MNECTPFLPVGARVSSIARRVRRPTTKEVLKRGLLCLKWTNGAVTSGDIAPQIADDVTSILRCPCVQAVLRLRTGVHIRQSVGDFVLSEPD